jgi:hypothetical protein
MNDPRHPLQPAAPTLPRTNAPAAPGVPPRPPMAQPVAPPQQRIPQAQPPVGLPRVGAPPMARPAVAHPAAMPAAPAKPQAAPAAHPAHPAPAAPAATDDDAISLVEDADPDMIEESAPAGPSKIKFGADIGIKKHDWKRELRQGGTGATRIRTFHGKLSDQGLEYIDEAINVWLDGHPEIDVKFVTTNVGMFDGKFKDLALIVNVWY